MCPYYVFKGNWLSNKNYVKILIDSGKDSLFTKHYLEIVKIHITSAQNPLLRHATMLKYNSSNLIVTSYQLITIKQSGHVNTTKGIIGKKIDNNNRIFYNIQLNVKISWKQ